MELSRRRPLVAPRAAEEERSRRSHWLLAGILLAPSLVLVFGLIAYPLGYEAALSLTDERVDAPGTFVGLANYVDLLADGRFWGAVATTAVYVVVATALKVLLGLAMALALARSFPGRPAIFVLLLVPWLYPAVLSATALQWMFNPVLYSDVILRLDRIDHALSIWVEEVWPLARVILIDVWRGTAFYGVFLLVGRNAIPADLLDVAALEGAGPWAVFRRVTLPLLRPALLLAVILSFGATLADFTNLYLLTGGREVIHVVGTLAYEIALTRGNLGLGAATSLAIVPPVGLLMLALVRFLERDEG
jgi:ABC-type sugar transport system permease subunit